MKIDAVELTLFAWDDIPPTRYTQGTQNLSGRSNLGLLRLGTDAGIEGHAFLGSATNPAETDAGALLRLLKPVLLGRNPLAREDLHAAMRGRQRGAARHWRLRYRALGHCRQGCGHAALCIFGRWPEVDRGLRLEPGAREPR